ncbi:MAG TPA: ABC transporter substrate-binding protein [Pyrinomonadaceae bacterium]|nr:ABC transporter substrate-binding protein [Pyrinomonadaceae bacterium]
MNRTGNRQRNHAARLVIVGLTLFALLGLSFAGCSSKEKPKVLVGFSQMENNTPWRVAETNSIKQEAAKRGYELVVTDAGGQASKQVSDVKDLIARKVSAIFLAPREFEALAPALQAAKEAKIPVFLIDREAAGKVGEDYVTFIGSNFKDQGLRAAQWLIAQTGGKANIVELTGTTGSSVARDRSQGFNDRIKPIPEMKVIASETGDFSREKAQKVMENLIKTKGKQVNAIFAHNDEMALGAIQALKAAGRQPGKDVVIVSIDGEKDALQAIINGEIGASVESSPRFGPLAFDSLDKYLNKRKLPTKIILEDRLFSAENAREYLDEAY